MFESRVEQSNIRSYKKNDITHLLNMEGLPDPFCCHHERVELFDVEPKDDNTGKESTTLRVSGEAMVLLFKVGAHLEFLRLLKVTQDPYAEFYM